MTYANGIKENASLGHELLEQLGTWQGAPAIFETWPDGTRVVVLASGARFFEEAKQ